MKSHYRPCSRLLQAALLIGWPGGSEVFASAMPHHCALFPANNAWNTPISALPVHPRSNAWIAAIGYATGFHMDFGSGVWDGGPIGIPFNVVSGAKVTWRPFDFYYPEESDPGPYPIPNPVAIEHGSDHHLLVVDADTCRLYEIYDASLDTQGWRGGSGAIWDLGANPLRPAGWTSADAAGLPILPGLVRYEEVAAGAIRHALRFTAPATQSYIWPARHLTAGTAGVLTNTPPMGARFRLKAHYPITGFAPELQVILEAMKTYGIILADNGSPWYVSGTPDGRWDNDRLHDLDVLTGSDFEAVDTACLQVAPDSAEANPAQCANLVVGNLQAAILPTARSVQVGQPATAFGTLINATGVNVTHCSVALPGNPTLPVTFNYQTTNASNQLVGTPNTPVNIPAGGAQSFVFGITPSAGLAATDIPLVFDCANTLPAPSQTGLNTFLLSASSTPVPDMIAIGATPTGDGVLRIPGSHGVHAFGTAAINIGGSGAVTATVDTGGVTLPLTLSLCQTNPGTGGCLSPPAASVSGTVHTQQAVTYAVFAQATGAIPFDPAGKRIFLRLASGGVVRGATSVAVTTH